MAHSGYYNELSSFASVNEAVEQAALYKDDAGVSATASEASATASAASATEAAVSASSTADTALVVAADAAAAAASAVLATASENNAATHAASANTDKLAAATSATNAATSATNAAAEATAATSSASSALTSKNAAASSATAAAASATAANTDKLAAASSATNAATSATNAASSATAASTSASSANTYASNASASASSASTSASNASGSATAAAGSATAAANSAATINTQSSPSDTTPGALMAVGAFGLGGSTVPTQLNNQDLNTLITGGYWNCTNPTNSPEGVLTHHVLVLADSTSSGRNVQMAQVSTSSNWYWRSQLSGTWSAWSKMFSSTNILGTVSQASGVPTGAVIERGSNANGDYIRYADGTQICTRTNMTLVTTGRTAYGTALYQSANNSWTFPAAFIESPRITGNSGDNAYIGLLAITGQTATTVNLRSISPASSVTSGNLNPIAIGQWF